MVRWSYVASRLAILSIVCVCIWLGLSPVLHWAVQRGGQAISGARWDVGALDASLWNSRLLLADVHVANPRQPMKNLLQFDTANLQVDRNELLRRRVLVRDGTISGLRFDTRRQVSGELAKRPETGADDGDNALTEQFRQQGQKWLASLSQSLNQDLEDKFESVRVSKDLSQRWPNEYDQLKQRADRVEISIRDLKQLYEQVRANPLAEPDKIRAGVGRLKQLKDELVAIRAELPRIKEQIAADRVAINEARKNDTRRIRELVYVDAIDGQTITDYLLGPELAARVSTWTEYFQRGRQLWDVACKKPKAERGRGVDVLLPGMRTRPDFLIEQLAINGLADGTKDPLYFDGFVRDLTNEPKLHGKPTSIQLSTRGSANLQMDIQMDRTGAQSRERLRIRCRDFDQLPDILGRPDQFAIAISNAPASLAIDVEFHDNELVGHITMIQPDVTLRPQLASQFGGQQLAKRIQRAMGQVDSLDSKVFLSGTIRRPKLQLQSDLGDKLASSFKLVLKQEIDHQRDRLASKAEQLVGEHLKKAEAAMEAKKQQVMQQLRVNQSDLDSIQQQLVGGFGSPSEISDRLIGRKSEWTDRLIR